MTSVSTFVTPPTSAQGAQIWPRKSKIRLSDLPSHLHSHFINELMPHLYEFFGINRAWEQPKLSDIQKIWRDVFPKKHDITPQSVEGMIVTLGPGVHLDVRFLGVALVLGFLLLPLATQICGKRVLGVM